MLPEAKDLHPMMPGQLSIELKLQTLIYKTYIKDIYYMLLYNCA